MILLSPLWISFGPILLINAFVLTSVAYFALTGKGDRHKAHDAAHRHTSKFLNRFFKELWVWWTDPVALAMAKARMTPNIITMIGFLFSPLTAILFALGHFGYAGWMMVVGATFDLFDGRVARVTGKETKSGEFFDSVMDRISEGICFIGLAYYFRESWIFFFVLAGLLGSMLVSYTRAKGDSVGVPCKSGSMQRPERIVYIGVSSILQPAATLLLLPFFATPPPFLVMAAIVFVGMMTNATTVYRMIYIMNVLDSKMHLENESIPQIMSKFTTHEGRTQLWEQTRKEFLEKLEAKKRIQK